ncbi:T9SS type A sorting domain-containing protein [Polaribacter sp. L3A8]|uniref:T9SS type A sorting domain-containing protein n=1 Tax=Polaribacter sp. L3A8 TaxID=2686361 RepID=UPI00131CFE2E|nr:T9SS type A sorting domain-containing protein [Polaribacter sp. L3A8]
MKINIKKTAITVGLFLAYSSAITAQSYPFPLPATVSATLNIKTGTKVKYKNAQLGLNLTRLSDSNGKDLFRKWGTLGARFPHGLFSNWYDWRTDETKLFGSEMITLQNARNQTVQREVDKLSSIKTFETSHSKVGIGVLESLYKERTAKFDIVWTFNMSADGRDVNNSNETKARYDDLKRRGLPVDFVEMGNENFYPGQRSTIIPNTWNYIARAKAMSKALKAKNRNIQVSVPMLRRGNAFNPNWNAALARDQSFFDAVTVHSYQGEDPDGNASSDGIEYGLIARKTLKESIDNYARKVTSKPIWLTEWGVKSAGGSNAVSALGAADCYLYMSENMDTYHRATWFTPTGSLNSFYPTITNSKGRPVPDPTRKTVFAAMYEAVKSVFAYSEVYTTSILTSPNITSGVKGVSARATLKGGRIKIIAVNLTSKPAAFVIKINGVKYTKNFNHKAIKFNNLTDTPLYNIGDNALKDVRNGRGHVTSLPKFSINVITLSSTSAKGVVLNDKNISVETEETDESLLRSVNVFPNPTTKDFNISLFGMEKADITITDMLGKVIYKKSTIEPNVNIGQAFKSGLYLIKVVDDNKKEYIKKLIIN